MKKYFFAAGLLTAAFSVQAQQKEGKVIYERTSQMQIQVSGMPGMENNMPRTRTDKFELSFGNGQSLWKQAEQENDDDGSFTTDNGAQVRMIVAGNDDVLFTNYETGKRVEKREMMDRTFVIDDTVAKLKWKMTGETRTILNMPCMKATTSRISSRMSMNIDNGKMERKEV
ncbi:MAG TPA: GLPGLI family protein, partial [Chitinophagaceae bacterium]|nr:GLPGLI family protein [Chitinophagaceae bacterium]